MARAGDEIENRATGERLRFVRTAADTDGDLLELEAIWPRPGQRTPEHVHPEMEESWEVLEGRACFRIAGEEQEAGPGGSASVPPGTAHVAWNPGPGPARVRLTFRPALRWEDFVERFFALTRDSRADRNALAALLREFPREIAPPR